jgi:hypothetical protein
VDSGVVAAMIGAVGAVGAAAVTAVIAQRTAPRDYSLAPIAPPLPAPVTKLTILRRIVGILLVGSGIGMLSAGAALFNVDFKGSSQGHMMGAFLIGWGSGSLAAGVLTLLYRRLP